MRRWHLGDEELRAVGVPAGVSHGQHAALIKLKRGIELVLKLVARPPGAIAGRISALNHELRNHAVKNGAVVQRRIVLRSFRHRILPILCSFGQSDKVLYRYWRLVLVEGAIEIPGCRLDDGLRIVGICLVSRMKQGGYEQHKQDDSSFAHSSPQK